MKLIRDPADGKYLRDPADGKMIGGADAGQPCACCGEDTDRNVCDCATPNLLDGTSDQCDYCRPPSFEVRISGITGQTCKRCQPADTIRRTGIVGGDFTACLDYCDPALNVACRYDAAVLTIGEYWFYRATIANPGYEVEVYSHAADPTCAGTPFVVIDGNMTIQLAIRAGNAPKAAVLQAFISTSDGTEIVLDAGWYAERLQLRDVCNTFTLTSDPDPCATVSSSIADASFTGGQAICIPCCEEDLP